MRRQSIGVVGMSVLLLLASVLRGEIQVVAQCNRDDDATPEFRFGNVASPSSKDAATQATLVLLDGRRDSNSGEIQTLCDGVVPDGDDEPSENFFFAAGTDGGRLLVDLGSTIDIKQVNTFSWHRSARATGLSALCQCRYRGRFPSSPNERRGPGHQWLDSHNFGRYAAAVRQFRWPIRSECFRIQ